MLYIEVECGGSDAVGGGCGAPLEFHKVSEETFEKTKGESRGEPFNHNPWECDFQEGGRVKLTFRACSNCRRREWS